MYILYTLYNSRCILFGYKSHYFDIFVDWSLSGILTLILIIIPESESWLTSSSVSIPYKITLQYFFCVDHSYMLSRNSRFEYWNVLKTYVNFVFSTGQQSCSIVLWIYVMLMQRVWSTWLRPIAACTATSLRYCALSVKKSRSAEQSLSCILHSTQIYDIDYLFYAS